MKVKFFADIWSVLCAVPVALLHNDLVAIATRDHGYLLITAHKIEPVALQELAEYTTRFVSVNNRATKTLLSASEAKYLNDRIREARAWLN